MVPGYKFSDIIDVNIPDPNGRNSKSRPVLVISPTAEIANDEPVHVAAISTSHIPDILPPQYFDIPWQRGPRGHPKTGLNARCVVEV